VPLETLRPSRARNREIACYEIESDQFGGDPSEILGFAITANLSSFVLHHSWRWWLC